MDFRRLPVLVGPVLAGLLVLGGCASGPGATPDPAATPAASAPDGGAQAPCTTRLRPGTGAGSQLTLTPEAQAELERLRALPPEQRTASTPDPALASRLAQVSRQVQRAAQPCSDR